jgi:creatinine amidohydrolase/Fe(II)-dependent formamide hydrolase-like protein
VLLPSLLLSATLPSRLSRPLLRAAALVLLALAGASARAADTPATSVYLEQLTWTEVRDALHAGKTTVIIPVGGTEQSGPYIALGKHNARAHVLAGQIATALGNALVAPVLAYVPEGAIQPPQGHMRFAGTISIPDQAFQSLLEGSANSFRQHGFTEVVLIGDHGGYQPALKAVAAKLNKAWARSGAHALYVAEYYQAGDSGFAKALRAKGYSDAQIGLHAGLADTSLTLALAPGLVRPLPTTPPEPPAASGINGDPRGASAALGQLGVDMMVARTVAAIRTAQQQRAKP